MSEVLVVPLLLISYYFNPAISLSDFYSDISFSLADFASIQIYFILFLLGWLIESDWWIVYDWCTNDVDFLFFTGD